MMSAAALAVIVVPILIRWVYKSANAPSESLGKFRPAAPLRALYPGGLVMFGWCFAFEVTNVWHSAGKLRFEDAGGLALATAGLAVTMLSWPIVIEVSEKELAWHKLVFRRHVAWDEVEDVNTGMDGGLIVYLSQSRRINVSSYTEGRLELKEFIFKHSKHTRNL